MSASNRANHKDIYDLDYLTDHIPLDELMNLLRHLYKILECGHSKLFFG
jgi:hypothetical protein